MTSIDTALPSGKLTFSRELRELAERFAGHPAQLREILETTQGRGFNLLLVFIALPFLTPIPLPGFSIPFGLVAFFIGVRLAMGKKPWLPQKLLAKPLPPRFSGRVLRAAARVVKLLELLLRPRLAFFQEALVFRRFAGALIMLSGVLLLLPLPLPFSNSLPALTILLLAAGALERDGAFFLAGCSTFLVTVGFFIFLALGGGHVMNDLWHTRIRGPGP